MAKCKICSKPSGYFPLCKSCSKLKDEGKITKCETCGVYHYTNDKCKCEKTIEAVSELPLKQNKCIVCEKDSPYGSLCKDCYYEMLDFKDSFDKNSESSELYEYYNSLKSSIYRMYTFDYVKTNCNKLMALATLYKDLYNRDTLLDKVENDIIDIISRKKDKIENITEDKIIKDSRKEELIRTMDGHRVKSNQEKIIDDILYLNRIPHCYEKNVCVPADEPTITADWFIPVGDERHGIYIEYWGMATEEYKKNKERKRKQYKEHDIPLIEIEKDEVFDSSVLGQKIIREINELAKKYFRVSDYMK